jgi:CheY-like chemotaxis protein
MNILLIEDDKAYIEAVSAIFAEMPGTPSVTVAQSKSSAERCLEADFFDLVILDLKIPTEDGLLDADPQHGRSTFYAAKKSSPGTPIFVLTGSPAEEFIGDFLGGSQQVDIWSEGHQTQTVSFLQKYKFGDFRERIEPMCKAVWNLSEVELHLLSNFSLTTEFTRLLRIFCLKYEGARCQIGLVGGGLSSAKVYRLRVTSSDGALIHNAIVKLGSRSEIKAEGERFETYISRLDASATPRKLCVLEFGAKLQAGIFYQLAADFSMDGFSISLSNPVLAATIPSQLKELMNPWRVEVPQTRHTIRDIRRVLLSDGDLRTVLAVHPTLWTTEFEARQIQVHWCCIHGDLHGKNVLISDAGRCVLIDYGDVGMGTAAIDPITYEFSLHFHPDGPLKNCAWPTTDQAAHWADLSVYLVNCPIPEVIRDIRAWTSQTAAGNREVAASAYAYLIRQYKYPDNNAGLISALLEAIHTLFLST